MKVRAPFIVEHSWYRGKMQSVIHIFRIRALTVNGMGKPWYSPFAPKGFAALGSFAIIRRRL